MAQNATMAEFEALLNESFKIDTPEEGSVVKGKVIAIEAGFAIVDVGYKMEGRVELKEFANPGEAPEVAVGDEVEVFLRQVENAKGEAVISREMARREEAWDRLEKAYADDARVDGAIFGRVKGGFTVDLGGAVAFLPGSQVDVRPVRDAGPLMGLKQPFQILKLDRRRGNIFVSRRATLEESRAEQRAEVIGNLAEGDDVEGDPGAHPDAVSVTMPAGSLMIARGDLWHRGGANRSDQARRVVTPQYCAGWLRPLESMLLSVTPEQAALLPERVRELLGYSIHPPFMGYSDGVHPKRLLP